MQRRLGLILAFLSAPCMAQERWWSHRALEQPRLPVTRSPWVRTGVDAFVLAALREHGLMPAEPADRRTLIRRLTFDLHGLPPTPEAIEAFVADPDPQAYEALVDRLLASPRYGERWARHWLDVVHYGETHGYDKDKARLNAWPYRDYVIRAFNADKPYRRFVEEQLAGDVLYPDHPDGIVATGFLSAGPWDFVGHVELAEGTAQKEITRLLDRDDMVTTTMATFVSTTAHCARCHDHKFDPIPQADYYGLQAVFAGVERADRPYVDTSRQAELADLTARTDALEARQEAFTAILRRVTSPAFAALETRIEALEQQRPTDPGPLPATGDPSPGLGYHSSIADSAATTKWVQVDLGRTVELDWIVLVPSHERYGGHDGPGFGFPARFAIDVSMDPAFETFGRVADHTARDHPHPGDEPLVAAAHRARARYVRVTATRLWPRTGDWIFALGELIAMAQGTNVAAGGAATALDSIEAAPRWARSNLTDGHSSRGRTAADGEIGSWVVAAARARDARGRIADLRAARDRTVEVLLDEPARRERAAIAVRTRDLDGVRARLARPPLVYAAATDFAPIGKFQPPNGPRPIWMLRRGDVRHKESVVAPGALSCFPELRHHVELPAGADEAARRVALARWICDPQHPLTWRSIVNRVWQYHFGRGLVDTPNDFGRMGSRPSHPELLDWLAVWFRDSGGSFKSLHRLLLLSATYRQSSRDRPAALAVDGDNRLLWRMHRRRLEAEAVRDAVLAVSGVLDITMGGPSVQLFKFEDDHSPRYDYAAADPDAPGSRRRSIYCFVVRSVPDPFLACLDAADASQLTPRRWATVTPLQALALLNDPFMVRQAERFAARLRAIDGSPRVQVDTGTRLALGRAPFAAERARLEDHVVQHGLESFCRLLFNLNEFVYVD